MMMTVMMTVTVTVTIMMSLVKSIGLIAEMYPRKITLKNET